MFYMLWMMIENGLNGISIWRSSSILNSSARRWIVMVKSVLSVKL